MLFVSISSKHTDLPLLRATIALLSITLLLSGCGNFKLQGGGTGSAEVYPGGDEFFKLFSGEFYLIEPAYKCGAMYSYKYRLQVEPATLKATIRSVSCDGVPAPIDAPWRGLSFAKYNTDYILKGAQVFSKSEYVPAVTDGPMIPELFCRTTNHSEVGVGADVLILRSRDGTKRTARIFAGEIIDGTYSTIVSQDFVPAYTTAIGTPGTYVSEGFEMRLDNTETFISGAMIAGHLTTNLLGPAYDNVLGITFKCKQNLESSL
jgi:hypothetical protein